MRVDAHQHYWHYDAHRDGWITPAMLVLRRDYLPSDIAPALAAAHVDAVIAVQADQSEAETDFLIAQATASSFVRGVVGWVDLTANDLSARLALRRTQTVVKGFRHIAQSEPDDFLTRPEIVAGISTLGEHGFTYDILIYPSQLAAAERLVAQCQGVQFVLDHCAKPPILSGDLKQWREGVRRLGRHRNVTCKVSGLVTEASWSQWCDADITPILDTVASAFGPHRLIFGSDWPVCLLAGTYARVTDVVSQWAEQLTAPERASLFGGAANTVYRLGA